MRALMTKTPQGALIPANGEAADMLEKIKVGKHVWVEVKRGLNTKFRAKWEILIDVGFDAWEPIEVNHPVLGRIVPEKDRASFRDAIKVACGYFHLQWNLDGTSRIVPDSVAFEKMDDDADFERRIYSPTINLLLKMVFTDKNEVQLRAWADRVLRFA